MFGGESINRIKMSIARDHGEVVLFRSCCNPDVVFRNWPAYLAKKMFDLSVVLSRRGIATENSVRSHELIDHLKVRFDARGFMRTVIQLA